MQHPQDMWCFVPFLMYFILAGSWSFNQTSYRQLCMSVYSLSGWLWSCETLDHTQFLDAATSGAKRAFGRCSIFPGNVADIGTKRLSVPAMQYLMYKLGVYDSASSKLVGFEEASNTHVKQALKQILSGQSSVKLVQLLLARSLSSVDALSLLFSFPSILPSDLEAMMERFRISSHDELCCELHDWTFQCGFNVGWPHFHCGLLD